MPHGIANTDESWHGLCACPLSFSMEAFIMTIGRKTLALLTAAVFGTGLVACQRGAEDKSASSQDSSSMNQAPRQGYTGPANPSTSSPPSTTDSTGQTQGGAMGDQTGSPSSTNPSNSQQQPQQNQQQR